MAVRPGSLGPARGFSLIELLVALSLLALVVLMMGLLMNSLRIQSAALLTGFGEPAAVEEPRLLDADLRMLLRSRPDSSLPVLTRDEENHLTWRRLVRDASGRDYPGEVRVFHDADTQAVIRILHVPPHAEESAVIWRGVSGVSWWFWDGARWHADWPPEAQKDAVPRLVRAEMMRGTERLRYDIPVPAAMRWQAEAP